MQTIEKLFSTFDINDIGSIICQPVIISQTVLRPPRLFIGIKETITINIKNITTSSILYKWGNPIGSDRLKLQFIFSCDNNCIPAGVIKSVKIICCPIEVGYVKNLYIPFYIEHSQKILFLKVECEIKSLYVTFYIPYQNDIFKTSDVCFEWHNSSISVRPNLLALQNSMLKKTISKNNCTTKSYINNLYDDSSKSFEMNQNTFKGEKKEKNYVKVRTKKPINYTGFNQLVSFNKIESIYHPVIIEFWKVPIGVVTKKTFLIKNETPIASSFWLKVNNFYPVYITEKIKIKEDMIKSIYKMIIGNHTEDIWNEIKQPNSGILIYVNPLITKLPPYKDVFVDIYVFVDTWGIYTDELEINILGLPQYILGICVQVIETPISFSICEKTQLKIPVCRFGILPENSQKEVRIIFLKNKSVVPLMINWQIVSTKNLSENYLLPFNIILRMRTLFSNNLALNLRKMQKKNEKKKLFRNRLKIYEFQNGYLKLNNLEYITSANTNSNQDSDTFGYEMYSNIFNNQYTNNDSRINKSKTMEFQLDLIPNYLKDKQIIAIYPEEIFIPPKGKAFVEIKIFPNNCPLDENKYKILYNALGFIEIAPMDKYKNGHYCRHNSLIKPIMIQIEAQILLSRLFYDIPKFNRLFTIYADDVMNNLHHLMKITKSYIFYNKKENPIIVKFEVNGPFTIEYIYTRTIINNRHRYIIHNIFEKICIDGWNSVEVHVSCLVNAKLIEEIIETNKNTILHNKPEHVRVTNNWCNRGQLRIIYTDHSSQILKLFLKIYLPLLQLSSSSLNFGHVCIGEEKQFILDIENLSAYKCKIEVRKTKFNEDFNHYPVMGEILARPANGKFTLPITVCFSPRNIGSSIEILKIMSTVPNYNIKCVLCGEGVLNENFKENNA